MDEKTRVFQKAQRDGGICAICFGTLNIGDGLWPIENPQIKKHRYSHVECAANEVGGIANLVPPVCKHWRKRGSCAFGDSCFFLHPTQSISLKPKVCVGNSTLNNKNNNGVKKRKPIANGSRAFVFRAFLIDTFGLDLMKQGSGVLDVGGGNGELAFQIINLNNCPATVVDPRPLRLRRFARKASFGMYTKNIFFNKYNDPQYDNGCLIPPEELVAPSHLRILFQQFDAAATGRTRKDNSKSWRKKNEAISRGNTDEVKQNISETSISSSSSSHEEVSRSVYPMLEALANFQSYESAVKHAESTAWTKKGLVHEDGGIDGGEKGEDEEIDEEPLEKVKQEELSYSFEDMKMTNQGAGSGGGDVKSSSQRAKEGEVLVKDKKDELIDQIAERLSSSSSSFNFDQAQNIIQNASLVVGLHPDQAASEIVAFATKYQKPFAIIPCCTYSREFPFRRLPLKKHNQSATEDVESESKDGVDMIEEEDHDDHSMKGSDFKLVTSYDDLVEWCVRNGPRGTRVDTLDFEGKNQVVYWKPEYLLI